MQRLDDFRQELRDRFGPLPESAQWLVRLAELRLLAARWQIVDVHLEKSLAGPLDVVLGYRNPRKIGKLATRSEGRIRVVDDATAYCRLEGTEDEPAELFALLQHLLRFPERPL
jgi:transcription-repair coupling factor (superfamily II helicase)